MTRGFVIAVMVVQFLAGIGALDNLLGASTRRDRGWQLLSVMLSLTFLLWGLAILVYG